MTSLKEREGKRDEPMATKTRLGWVLSGNSRTSSDTIPNRLFHVCSQSTDQELHELVKKFFSVESTGVMLPSALDSAEDRRAKQIMEATTTRIPGGKFQTGLLWKYDVVDFPNSRPMAERRLFCLEKRLARNPELYANVRKQISDYQAKGYAHVASNSELSAIDRNRIWYLPLRVVINPKKPEKVRVVWDAAATVQGISLNSVLLKGPDLLTPLSSVLSRYRQKQVAVSGDVREMFHQVFIRPEDRQAQRFLWRDHPELPIQVYIMDVATFGATCSPCSLQYIKNKNAEEQAIEFPVACEAVMKNHYVDDYLDSVDTVDEAVQLVNDVSIVHARGGFEIRNWLSSSSEVLRRIGEHDSTTAKSFGMDKSNKVERVLGMTWLPKDDVFSYSIRLRDDLRSLLSGEVVPTKREAFSLVMSVFDPLGFVAALLIHGKVLLQDVWRSAIGWDDQIPTDIFPRWRLWVQLLRQLENVRIPRCYFSGYGSHAYNSLELHIFVDASELAYAAVAYFRIVDDGAVRCSLVAAKTKVDPIKPLSIPRLELQAAVLGTRLMKTVISDHTIKITRKVLWSDSSTVLSWLRSDLRRRTQFVAFRVREILEATDVDEWRWVPSKWNVADDAIKWTKETAMLDYSRWFSGPDFIYENMDYWPQYKQPQTETSEEMRSIHVLSHSVTKQIVDFQRFSKFERLIRSVAFMNRFYNNCKRKLLHESVPITEVLSSEELKLAEFTIWKLIQLDEYAEEFAILQRNKLLPPNQQEPIKKSSKIYKLSPSIGVGGIIRMERRMREANWASEDMKSPIIAPKKSYVTHLLIDWYHRRFHHANGETVVNEIIQKYYISALRVAVRIVCKRCNWCKIDKSKPQTPRMGPLPAVRVTPYIRPFSFVGLDYFGPLTVRIGRSNAKRWVALFTCLTVRAVHLEVAYNLSTGSCKMAIRRFIARRGAPLEIYSDQGTNFQGANRDLKTAIEAINSSLAGTFTNAATQWKFNPPYAPHMGGVWERLVRSVKVALAYLPVARNPDEEILSTVLIEIEAMVNTRPLTYIPLDNATEEALTPNHFLLLSSSCVGQPAKLPVDPRTIMRSSWNLAEVMLDRFWTRWIHEYLPVITRQTK
ncbi:uncharacterized protein LOC131434094 [Malaya genurostris]|uniref:uncharacterized protein LOC131434094 n=1 Tax=Malaya genurostris TaxID=325434 RepID=UPI0026F3C663|nr:uncharacterized protein LOC131434094 [Malaya genurostris]